MQPAGRTGVFVFVGVLVAVGVDVAVFVKVRVAVGVLVKVLVCVGVLVAVAVLEFTGVFVGVGAWRRFSTKLAHLPLEPVTAIPPVNVFWASDPVARPRDPELPVVVDTSSVSLTTPLHPLKTAPPLPAALPAEASKSEVPMLLLEVMPVIVCEVPRPAVEAIQTSTGVVVCTSRKAVS